MAGGLHPILALAKSGASNDPVADYEQSKDWVKLRWGDPDAIIGAESMMPAAGANGMEGAADGQQASQADNGEDTPGRVKAYWQMRNGRKVLIDSYTKRTNPSGGERPE